MGLMSNGMIGPADSYFCGGYEFTEGIFVIHLENGEEISRYVLRLFGEMPKRTRETRVLPDPVYHARK